MNTAQQSTINPAFAGHVSDKLRELSGDLHGVFDNLREIARGDDPKANGYDRIRAIKILYDRGCGKVTRNQARTNANGSANGAAPKPEPRAAAAKRPVAQLEQKLDDALGPPQAPAEPDEATAQPQDAHKPHGLPAPSPGTPKYTPDLVRDSQYYVLEITNYGDELATLLWDIHEADPDGRLDQVMPPHSRGPYDHRPRHRNPCPTTISLSTTGTTPLSNPTGSTSTPQTSTPTCRLKSWWKPTAQPAASSRT